MGLSCFNRCKGNREGKVTLSKGNYGNAKNSRSLTPKGFTNAIEQGDKQHVSKMLKIKEGKKGFVDFGHLDEHGENFLFVALRSGHDDIAEMLLQAGMNPNEKCNGIAPLHAAAEHGADDMVRVLLKHKADVNVKRGDDRHDFDQNTPLIEASCKGHFECAKMLIDAGADINFQSKNNLSAMFVAASAGHGYIAEALLEAGADVNAKCGQLGATALINASRHGDVDIVDLLFEHHADVNLVDNSQQSALAAAVQRGHSPVVEVLLENGADVDAKNCKTETTALMYAAEKGQAGTCQLLLRNKASINVRNRNGEDALGLAVEQKRVAIVHLLLSNGATSTPAAKALLKASR